MEFSFESIKESLKTAYSAITDYTYEILQVSVLGSLVDLIAWIVDKLAYYMEFLYRESIWKTAILRESLIPKAYLLGYAPHRKIGARGQVQLSSLPLDTESSRYTGGDIAIPKWTIVESEDGEVGTYTIDSYVLFDNTLIVKKQLSTTEPPAYLGNNLTRIRVDTHTIPVGAEVRLTGTKNYNGIYTNFNDSSDDSILNNYIYIEKEYVAENFLVGATVYSGQIYAEVAEGTPREFTYVAVGSADEEIVLFTDTSDNNYLDVDIVDAVGNVIAPVTVIVPPQKELFLTNDTDNYYCELENRNDFSALIFTFGDGLNTKKLNPGDLIRFRYADTLGDLGNVASKGLVTRVNGNLSTANGSPATIYLTNLDPIVGGQGYESLESIRSNGKNLFQAGYRAGSENDWKTIVEKHPSVLKASIWTEYDVNPSAITGRNNIIYITGVSTIGQALDVSVEQDVANNFLADKKSPSDIVFFRRLLIVNAKFKVQATISPQAKAGIVKNDITNSLLAKYAVVNSNFFANVHDSNFTRIIDNNSDVEFNSTEVFHVEKSEFHPKIQASVGGYEVVVSRIPDIEPDPSKQILIEEDSVEIWILRKIGGEKQEAKQIAETSGDTITGINNYSISNGTVSYFTNQISFTINNLLPGGFVPVGEPDYNTGDPPGSGTGPTPYTAFGNLNPLESETQGYLLRVQYKTKSSSDSLGKTFENDIRLPNFYNIVDFNGEDIEFDFSF